MNPTADRRPPGTAPPSGSGDPPQSYEAARAELADVLRRLESGGQGLEESLALWERGEALADACEQLLAGARKRLDAAISRRQSAAADVSTDGNAADED